MKLLLLGLILFAGLVRAEDSDSEDFDTKAFTGAVLKRNGFACGRRCVISEDGGMAYKVGRNSIISTEGYFYTSRNNLIGKDTYVTKTRNFYYGTQTSIQAGDAYMNDGGVIVGCRDADEE